MPRDMPREKRFSARALAAFRAGPTGGLAVRAAAANEPAEILLYDEIGFWGVTASDFVQALAQAGAGRVRVRINSPGGDVFDGLSIYNALKNHPGGAETVVDGLAASAASFIAMAGQPVVMNEASMFMVHNAAGVVVGNKADLTHAAGVLGQIDAQLAAIYAGKTGKPVAEIAAMMDAETWITSTDAAAQGFCDTVLKAAEPEPQNAVTVPASVVSTTRALARLRLAEAEAL